MKLYTRRQSPFGARVRITLAHKQIGYEALEPPEADLKSPAFLALNPMGKIPLLITDEGQAIAESETILDYLEDRFPTPPLRLAGPAELARMRSAIRVFENYVAPPLFRLFEQLDPAARDPARLADELRRWRAGLALLARFVDDAPYAAGGRLTLADCMVFPGLQLCEVVAPMLGAGDVVGAQPRLAAYYAKAKADPLLRQAHDDLLAGLAELTH